MKSFLMAIILLGVGNANARGKESMRWIASGGCATTDVAYPKEMLPVTHTENAFDCMSICLQTVGCGYINWCSPGISNCDNDCAVFSASLPIIKGNGYPGHNCYAKNTYTDCPERNIDYPFNDLGPPTFLESTNNTWEGCGRKCQDNPDYCFYWSFNPNDGACWLKTMCAESNRKSNNNRISGSRGCPSSG